MKKHNQGTDIAPDLENCPCQGKKDAYTYLDLKVTATPEGADIKGYIQLCVLTIERTSGCLPFHEYVRNGADDVAVLG